MTVHADPDTSSMERVEDLTDIRIDGPLPASVVGTLIKLIGAAWPDAMMADPGRGGGLLFKVRGKAKKVKKKNLKQLKMKPIEDDTLVNTAGPDGISVAPPEVLAAAMLDGARAAFSEYPDAENYLESVVIDREENKRYVMIFARSKEQTPHELRMAAEQKLTTARADVADSFIRKVQVLQRFGPGHRANTYAAGVEATLEALREMNFGRTHTGETSTDEGPDDDS